MGRNPRHDRQVRDYQAAVRAAQKELQRRHTAEYEGLLAGELAQRGITPKRRGQQDTARPDPVARLRARASQRSTPPSAGVSDPGPKEGTP